MQIINILLIEHGIPVSIDSFPVYEEQDISFVRIQAQEHMKSLIVFYDKEITIEELEDRLDFVHIHKDFEVHLINSFI